MRKSLVIAACLFMVLPVFSQTRVLKGEIITFNHYAVQNVEVVAKKAKSAVKTDSLGQFELVCNEKDVITVKTKVFDQYSKKVTSKDDFISANLVFRDNKKNREMATGMGYIKPDQLSYALAHLSHENNNFCSFSNVFNLLTTNFPELQLINGAGGGVKGVCVRGQKSLSSTMQSESVYEVDGMIVSDISFLSPCDISSINIMKSGGTAVYGTQAVNGVIIIKTKGRQNPTQNP